MTENTERTPFLEEPVTVGVHVPMAMHAPDAWDAAMRTMRKGDVHLPTREILYRTVHAVDVNILVDAMFGDRMLPALRPWTGELYAGWAPGDRRTYSVIAHPDAMAEAMEVLRCRMLPGLHTMLNALALVGAIPEGDYLVQVPWRAELRAHARDGG